MNVQERAPDAPLTEVEWRVDGKPNGNRCRYVPYLSATTVARLLDEWVGPARWKDDYEQSHLGKGLWGVVSIKFGDEWVTKRDVGVPSNFEAEKGTVSDAFKRVACIKWGVGRNVYSLPNVWAPCRVDDKGRAWPTDATLPAIRQELKKLGYEASGRLAAQDESDVQPSKEVTSPGEGTPSHPPKDIGESAPPDSSQGPSKATGSGDGSDSRADTGAPTKRESFATASSGSTAPATSPQEDPERGEPGAGSSSWEQAIEAYSKRHRWGGEVAAKIAKVALSKRVRTPGNWKQVLETSEIHEDVARELGLTQETLV